MNKRGFLGGLIFFFSVFALSFVILAVLIPKSDPQLKKSDFLKNKKISLNYIAIGDSLTEGVGDLTNQGGFVPLLSGDLGDYFNATVNTENYGVSGNTSQQILTRMTENKEITEQLKKANLMTLTVGGNDVLAVIRKNLANLKVSNFKKPARQYQERLRKILDLARKDNQDLPIFVLGIYNPFYLNFQELTEMQTVINDWNKKTQEVVDDYDHVYFIPINDLLYKGVDGKEGIVQSTGEQTTIVNDALFSGDHFHPNNTGYQIMSDAVMETIRKNGKEIKP
ncbi:GDSL-like lipase/acylhydrolase protein [Streptococcus equi subsp. zooepidemicus]|uniref:SGNH/GDSL hydrolase family protein n=1 Tax=Streptococcus equi TaxID=1336 RepID=UPI000DA37B78|nr:SGNH/GDSL hydrolase family protein [Streptococcus equi]SQF81316.1 GDSL-like lipase/acylhydrolase protein [Streptococcus equi subsp. zooepidemicus]